MKTPLWLSKSTIITIHEELLQLFGGGSGFRDEGALDSSLARPLNLYHYENPTIFDLAATYADGIVKSHPFLDGNKRTGFMAAYIFLGLNGYDLIAAEEEAVIQVLELAKSAIGVPEFSAWLADWAVPRK